jgi:chromosome partitioning protein
MRVSQHSSGIAAAFDDSPIMRQLQDLSSRRRQLDDVEIDFTGKTRVLTVSNQKGGVGKTLPSPIWVVAFS